jgi:hypothetical protein
LKEKQNQHLCSSTWWCLIACPLKRPFDLLDEKRMLCNVVLLLSLGIEGAGAFSAPAAGALIGMGALKAGKTLCQVSLFVLTGVLAQRE